MRFKKTSDARAWCNVGNRLWLAVERACIPHEKRCWKSEDPRLRALATVIYQMTQQFEKELVKRMKWIEDHENEFVVKDDE